jgi:hypothetical protein
VQGGGRSSATHDEAGQQPAEIILILNSSSVVTGAQTLLSIQT